MSSPRGIPPLHVVTDHRLLDEADFLDRARKVLGAGLDRIAFHVRSPEAPGRAVSSAVEGLLPLAREAGALLLVNDRVDVARALGADGVQLGRRSLAPGDARRVLGDEALVGVSVHGSREVAELPDSVDFALLGTLYATKSHPGRDGAGLDLIRRARDAWTGPIVGIGGITPERAARVRAAGADGVAVISGVWSAPEPGQAVEAYLRALEPER